MKNVHADFYGNLDVNFVVTVFDPNMLHVLGKETLVSDLDKYLS